MKKRDYYILGLLICIVIYAASHRKLNQKENRSEKKSIIESHVKTDLRAIENDSLGTLIRQTLKAEA